MAEDREKESKITLSKTLQDAFLCLKFWDVEEAWSPQSQIYPAVWVTYNKMHFNCQKEALIMQIVVHY